MIVNFQYIPVVYDILKMKNCEIKERAMGKNQKIITDLSCVTVLQEPSHSVTGYTVTILDPSHWEDQMF